MKISSLLATRKVMHEFTVQALVHHRRRGGRVRMMQVEFLLFSIKMKQQQPYWMWAHDACVGRQCHG